MDEPSVQDRLRRIEQRQYLVVALLVVPYLVVVAELLGVWVAGVLYAVFGLAAFTLVALFRRRDRTATEE